MPFGIQTISIKKKKSEQTICLVDVVFSKKRFAHDSLTVSTLYVYKADVWQAFGFVVKFTRKMI